MSKVASILCFAVPSGLLKSRRMAAHLGPLDRFLPVPVTEVSPRPQARQGRAMAAPDTTISPPRTGCAMIAQGKAQRSPGAGHGSPREPRRGRATIASRRMRRGLSGLRGVWPPPTPGLPAWATLARPVRGEDPLHGHFCRTRTNSAASSPGIAGTKTGSTGPPLIVEFLSRQVPSIHRPCNNANLGGMRIMRSCEFSRRPTRRFPWGAFHNHA